MIRTQLPPGGGGSATQIPTAPSSRKAGGGRSSHLCAWRTGCGKPLRCPCRGDKPGLAPSARHEKNAYYSEGIWGQRAPARKATRSAAADDTDPAERENVARSHHLEQPSGKPQPSPRFRLSRVLLPLSPPVLDTGPCAGDGGQHGLSPSSPFSHPGDMKAAGASGSNFNSRGGFAKWGKRLCGHLCLVKPT